MPVESDIAPRRLPDLLGATPKARPHIHDHRPGGPN
jgi:hypothetical protein